MRVARVRRGSRESQERLQRESGEGQESVKRVRRGSRENQERVHKGSGEGPKRVRGGSTESGEGRK